MTTTLDDRSKIVAALEAAQHALDEARALLAASVAAPTVFVPTVAPEWVNLSTAAYACGRHADSMARLVRAHGLGRRVGRDWRIDMVRVRAWQEGRPFEPLPPAASEIVGDRGTSSEVS